MTRLKDLENRIKKRDIKIAVVGLGYVGLPLLLLLSDLGFRAVGIDRNLSKVQKLNKGILEFLKNNLKAKTLLKKSLKSKKFQISQDFSKINDASLIFITVDTPIDNNKMPDHSTISSACAQVGKNLIKGSIVIIESTIAPKTTQNIIIPIIEKNSNLKPNKDFFVAVCSERIRPNQDVFEDMKKFPRVIGTSSGQINTSLKMIYQMITKGKIDLVDCLTAEIVKTAENALRDVKIAFSNEIALLCEEINADVWKVRELVNNRTGQNDMLMPGPGVGGHCLPKDPWLLLSSTKNQNMKIIPSSRAVNSSMPKHIAGLISKTLKENDINIPKAKVLILGYSYIENCEDTRNSPTIDLVNQLKKRGIKKIVINDPFVEQFDTDIYKIAKGADCIILTVKHKKFQKVSFSKLAILMRNRIVFDSRNFFSRKKCERLGFTYHALGAL